jgi:IS30 family transposase
LQRLCPWQKGWVENPTADYGAGCHVRSTSTKCSDQEIQDIVITANLTPRKCLGFKTPLQEILEELGKDVQIRFA